MLEAALRLLDWTPWHLFQLQASGFPRELCSQDCQDHRDQGMEAMEDCECLTCHSCYSATRDPARLIEMWDRHPHGLLALRTGLKSNVFVVDCDVHEGGANGIESLRKIKTNPLALPQTVTSLSGGGGIHLFYTHPGEKFRVKSSSSKLAPAIDIKGENSYVVLPPSTKAGKLQGYRWLKGRAVGEWEIRNIDPLVGSTITTIPEPPRQIDTLSVDFSLLALNDFEDALGRLKWAVVGEQNNRLFQASCRAGEAVAGGALTLADAESTLLVAGMEYFNESTAKKTIRSGIRTGLADAQRGYVREIR